MKKLTKEQWEGVKESYRKWYIKQAIGGFDRPLSAMDSYPLGFDDCFLRSTDFFEKEVVEDTETPGEEKCLYCEFGHNGKNNPNAGTHFKQEGGRCTQCGSTFPQEKGSKPESSWERKEWVEELHEILNDRTSGVIDDVHIYSLIRKVEKEAYNLALEEAEKVLPKEYELTDLDFQLNPGYRNLGEVIKEKNRTRVEIIEKLKALKK